MWPKADIGYDGVLPYLDQPMRTVAR
ncbi:uncharacterized protein METZ01_LOCUS135327 [marine metagenome]|uniref:Uncharacterized protein n=1 Tax=marine metagenome TaxID=408172 RepID=A0A381Z0X4_9ZZZZ